MKKTGVCEVNLKVISAHAEREYPKECCGVIVGQAGEQAGSRVIEITNVQDDFHARNPKDFPRTSRSAYFMDPAELLRLHKILRQTDERLLVIYHSHVDAPVVFSSEDKFAALQGGAPAYPSVDYLVLSVMKGRAKEAALYRFRAGDFEAVFQTRL